MGTPEQLIEMLARIIKTAAHQDEVPQLLNGTLVKDIHFRMEELVHTNRRIAIEMDLLTRELGRKNTKCEYPECSNVASGGSINGGSVCIDHVEWAMARAFKPVEELRDILDD